MPNEPLRFVTCRCQHCNGNIEFDASDFQTGETRPAECPHCHLETILYVPQPTAIAENRPKPSPRPKVASPKKAVILWITTAVLFFIVLPISGDSDFSGFVGLLAFGFLIAAAIATGKYKSLKRRLTRIFHS